MICEPCYSAYNPLLKEVRKDFLGLEHGIKLFCEILNEPPSALKNKGRQGYQVEKRQMIMSMLYYNTSYSLEQIGNAFGGRDHSTVIHSLKKVKKRCKVDSSFKEKYDYLKKQSSTFINHI